MAAPLQDRLPERGACRCAARSRSRNARRSHPNRYSKLPRSIIVSEGYEKATTNYIAEKAGVSIGSLYQYFPNKDAIISALIEQEVSKVATGLRAVLRESMELPLEQASRRAYTFF